MPARHPASRPSATLSHLGRTPAAAAITAPPLPEWGRALAASPAVRSIWLRRLRLYSRTRARRHPPRHGTPRQRLATITLPSLATLRRFDGKLAVTPTTSAPALPARAMPPRAVLTEPRTP
ncbi:hypothetical protein U9M48_022595 [Paspalum notatum var. saurae]|uniref:Uncharacterized protein n=1 Tax=Paspalum notatum var. saurae TaxID=547442 RepID=A0AAQ3WU54_PASNO